MLSERVSCAAGALTVLIFVGFMVSQAHACTRTCSAKNYTEDGSFNAAKRNATFDCMFKVIDTNKDHVISESEFEYYRQHGLNWIERKAGTWSRVKSWCNCGCTNTLTFDDIYGSYRTCLGPDQLGGADTWIDQAYKRLCANQDPTDLTGPDNVSDKDWKGPVTGK